MTIIPTVQLIGELSARGLARGKGPRDEFTYLWPVKELKSHLSWVSYWLKFKKYRRGSWDCDDSSIYTLNYLQEKFAIKGLNACHSYFYTEFHIALGCEVDYWKQFGLRLDPAAAELAEHAPGVTRCDDGKWYVTEGPAGAIAPLDNFLNDETELGQIISRLDFVFW